MHHATSSSHVKTAAVAKTPIPPLLDTLVFARTIIAVINVKKTIGLANQERVGITVSITCCISLMALGL